MSYILDALRRSERERKPGASPAPPGAVHQISAPLPSKGWPLYVGIVLLLGLLFLLSFAWRNLSHEPQTVLSARAVPEMERTAAPIQSSMEISETRQQAPVALRKSTVLDLAEQTQVTLAPLKSQGAIAADKTSNTRIVPSAPEKWPTRVLNGNNANVPFLRQMSTDFQRRLPEMAVTIHVYSPSQSQQILFINNREYQKGDQVSGGARIEDIVEDGVVLSYQGEKFKLSRPH